MMMLKTRADLIKIADASEAAAIAAGDVVENQTRKMLKTYKAKLAAFLRDPETFGDSAKLELAFAGKAVSQIQQIFEDSGRDDVIGSLLDGLPDLTSSARDYFSAFGDVPELGGTSEAAINAYIQYIADPDSGFFPPRLDAVYVAPIQGAVWQSLAGNNDRDTAIDAILGRSDDLSETQVTTLVDDTFRQYQRAVTNVTAAELDLNIFWYQGPDDDRTSPQCQYILEESPHGVPGMWLQDEINVDMVPGIPLDGDPLVMGGHSNCRHKFYPISADLAKSEGFETGQDDDGGDDVQS